jgi:hypothetical protein
MLFYRIFQRSTKRKYKKTGKKKVPIGDSLENRKTVLVLKFSKRATFPFICIKEEAYKISKIPVHLLFHIYLDFCKHKFKKRHSQKKPVFINLIGQFYNSLSPISAVFQLFSTIFR